MTEFKDIGKFKVNPRQRERFISGELWQEWSKKYPDLFDADDVRIVRNQPKYHFYEWLAAILIYHSTGYLSLVELYYTKTHKRKQSVLKKINSSSLNELIAGQRLSRVKFPDLLVYSPDFTDWFFCEVKGGGDRLPEVQEQSFRKLVKLTQKPVCLIHLSLPRFFP